MAQKNPSDKEMTNHQTTGSVGSHKPDPDKPTNPAHQSPVDGPSTVEIGGRKGPDPTRYGDWEKNGRCIDF